MPSPKYNVKVIENKKHRRREKSFYAKFDAKKYDFLQYWRIVRHWAKRKYKISQAELDILLYLYSIPLFSFTDYHEFEKVLSWDKQRFKRFIKDGHIIEWRPHSPQARQKRLYMLSFKTKRMITSIYDKLLLEQPMPVNPVNNPIFRSKGPSIDKYYRSIMRKMNEKQKNRQKDS